MNTITEQEEISKYSSIKIAIWLYFILWIFEGALRKWFLPSLATPLLVVRDPIAIYILYRAVFLKVKFINPYIILSMIFTLLSLAITLSFGHASLFVGIYGARIMLLHFPLIFIIGQVFDKVDVLKMGRALLLLNVFMTLIVYFQFSSPQTALINVGIGGEGSAGFSGAMGYSRPPGTFSFITGLALFYTAVSVFIFYFWLSKDSCSKFLLIASTVALVIGLPLTISRGAVVSVIIVGFFAFIASITNSKTLIKLFISCVVFYLVILVLQSYVPIFNLGTEVFMDRVDTANKLEGDDGGFKESILLRVIDEVLGPIIELFNYPLFEGKLGMGTNAGAKMLTGKTIYLVSEMEMGRLIGEQGIILGLAIIIIRVTLALNIAVKSWKLPQDFKLLPFILCGAACTTIFQGQWAQPSVLGFAVIMAGLVMVSFKKIDLPLQNK